jgi:hypothetical protein
MYRELKKLNSPKINEPIKKWATELNRTFSKQEIQVSKKHMKEMLTVSGCKGNTNENHGNVKPLWKTIWRLLKNLNIDLPYDPAIPLLGIYPK